MTTKQNDRTPLAGVLTANAVSVTGNSLTLIGVPWFALETTGSPGKAGLVAFFAAVPVVLAAVAGGPVLDRIGRRRVSITSDLVCGLALTAIPLLHQTGLLRFWMLCALMAVTGLFHAPGETARYVLVPDLAGRAGTSLTRAASLYDAVARGARMTGAAIAGLLVAFMGPGTVLYIDAATFAVSALLVTATLRGVPSAEPLREGPRLSVARYRADLREGYSFLLRTRLMLGIMVMVMVTNGLNQSWSSVLLPVHAREELGGPAAQGLLVSVFAGCALAGALLYGAIGERFPRRVVFTAGFLIGGAPPYVVAALTDTTAPLLVTLAVSGLGIGVLNPILATVAYEQVPDELRSRVTGASTAGVLLTTPLGGLVAGLLVERVGLTATLLGIGTLYFLTTLSPMFFPAWRGMDAPPKNGPAGTAKGTDIAGVTDGADGAGDTAGDVSRTGPSIPAPAAGPAGTPPRR
ncbi:putative MFS family arabinose efflux permease [Streptomyces sp. PanSC19]|uniref:MFS transporter n=1 Tax=Streptomyces sp. PanSC19 TaxID=1520455 RepID=UPI000FBDCEC2|nr:MFS transporter [Streptomyces sp. PanSC19]ROQ32617.1 putative MFS family arabinose efflux permease [Streptomyces sp. PanSC19]